MMVRRSVVVMMVMFSVLVPLGTAASFVSGAMFWVVIAIGAGTPTPLRVVLAVFFPMASDLLLFADFIPVVGWSCLNATRVARAPLGGVPGVPVWKLHLDRLFPLLRGFRVFRAVAVIVDLAKGDAVGIHSAGGFLATLGRHVLPLGASWTSNVLGGARVFRTIVLEGVAFLFIIIVQEGQATLLLCTHANTKRRLV